MRPAILWRILVLAWVLNISSFAVGGLAQVAFKSMPPVWNENVKSPEEWKEKRDEYIKASEPYRLLWRRLTYISDLLFLGSLMLMPIPYFLSLLYGAHSTTPFEKKILFAARISAVLGLLGLILLLLIFELAKGFAEAFSS